MLERSEPMVKAEEPGCEIYVKNDADGKYFPQTEIDGHTYELMTDKKEQQIIALLKAAKSGEIEVKVTNNNENERP